MVMMMMMMMMMIIIIIIIIIIHEFHRDVILEQNFRAAMSHVLHYSCNINDDDASVMVVSSFSVIFSLICCVSFVTLF